MVLCFNRMAEIWVSCPVLAVQLASPVWLSHVCKLAESGTKFTHKICYKYKWTVFGEIILIIAWRGMCFPARQSWEDPFQKQTHYTSSNSLTFSWINGSLWESTKTWWSSSTSIINRIVSSRNTNICFTDASLWFWTLRSDAIFKRKPSD